MFFFIEDDLLEKCNTIWDKVGAVIKKNLIANLSTIKKNKISWWWSCRFLCKKNPTVNSSDTCLAIISLCSAFKKDKNYYPQVFLKECKYAKQKIT